jgi:hypothetical protein
MPVMFVGRVAIEDDELDQPHEFEVTVNAPSGDPIFGAKGTAVPPPQIVNQNPELYVGLNWLLQIPLAVNEEGLHWVNFKVDNVLMTSLPLLVKLLTAAP